MENIATAARVIETNSGRHTLNFSIPKSGSFKVSVRAVGLDSDENLQITESNIGKVDAGYVFIEADKSERISLSVLLNRPSLGSYRIVCEELKK